MQESQGLQKRVQELESMVQSYINRLNSIDLGFASQVKSITVMNCVTYELSRNIFFRLVTAVSLIQPKT